MRVVALYIAAVTVATAQLLRLTSWYGRVEQNLEAELRGVWVGKTYAVEIQTRVAAQGGPALNISPQVFRTDVHVQAHTGVSPQHFVAIYGAHTSLHTLDNWIHGVTQAPLYNDWRTGVAWIGTAELMAVSVGVEWALYRSIYPSRLPIPPRYWLVFRWATRGGKIHLGGTQRIGLGETALIEGGFLFVVRAMGRCGVGIATEWSTLDWRTWKGGSWRTGILVQLQ